jgi:RimJ/RimL family protein N-acetyltransferase
MIVLETDRLILSHASIADSAFMLELLNDPEFLRNIGDRGVRTVADAGLYISKKMVESYAKNGFGLYIVALKDPGTKIGICGLVKRDTLKDADLGFAFLATYRSRGYGYESAAGVLAYSRNTLGIKRIAGITNPENLASIRLLEKLGLRFEKKIRLSEDGPETSLFLSTL